MCKRWMGGALLAIWLGLAVSAHAQYLPNLGGADPEPEPLPGVPVGTPSAASPSPGIAPSPALTLPQDAPAPLEAPPGNGYGFSCAASEPAGCRFYAGIGAMALQRSRLTAGTLAVVDPNPGGPIPTNIPMTAQGIPLGQPEVQNFRNLNPPYAWGVRATAGVQWDNQAVEWLGWYIAPSGSSDATVYPGQIDTLFFNPPGGFVSGRQADSLITTQNTSLWNSEVNYRCYCSGFEFLAGVRYLQVRDALNIDTIGNLASPVATASDLAVTAYNRMVVGQVGLEYNLWLLSWLSVGLNGKAGFGPDFIHTNVSLTRPDGYIGFNSPHTRTSFGQIYEIGGYVDLHFLDRFRVRGGWITLWLEDVATSVGQVDFNLRGDAPAGATFQQAGDYARSQPHGLNTLGGMFFNGPMIEALFLF